MSNHPLRRRAASRQGRSVRTRRTQSSRRTATPDRPRAALQGILSGITRLIVLLGVLLLGTGLLVWFSGAGGPRTFLILGVDQRPEERYPTRADTILLAHVDPDRERAVLLSIPRDLWLPQPRGPANRINTAVPNGAEPDDIHAGPRYLAQTIQENFGIPVQGYVMVNFTGFVQVVDAAGGVTVDVPALLVDNAYPTPDFGVTQVRFEPGPQRLDGERALIYVRTRHQDGDFGRAARQQQLLQALARQLLQPRGWLRLPGVLAAALDAVQTDLGLWDVPALLRLAIYLATDRAQFVVLGREYTDPWTSPGGAAVLLPRWSAIQPLLAELFPGE